MNPRLRHVRRARFSVQHEDDARRGRTLLQDALHTASLGDEGRVFIVRSLDLGKLSLRTGSTAWSLRLEERMRSLRSSAVPVGSPAAARANAVYFDGPLEAWLQLATRAARGEKITEWYWRAAAPGWDNLLSATETLRLVFARLAEQGLFPSFVLAKRLREEGCLQALLRALQSADTALFFPGARAGVAVSAAARTSEISDEEASADAAVPLPAWVHAQIRTWGGHDPRSLWLIAAMLHSPFGPPPLPELELRRIAHVVTCAPSPAPVHPSKSRITTQAEQPSDVSGVDLREAHIRPKPRERIGTAAGGLFFLVPLLTRTGFGRQLLEHRDWQEKGLAWKILQLALRHSQPPRGDALAAALPGASVLLPSGLAWRPLLTTHRLGRKLTTMPLAELIRRPAQVALNETHLDVFFRPSEVDVRIRRAALDLDPGWVPWLGRVVNFHYTRED